MEDLVLDTDANQIPFTMAGLFAMDFSGLKLLHL